MDYNSLCNICCIDTDSIKGAYLMDGDATNGLTFICPICYKLIVDYTKVKVKKLKGDLVDISTRLALRIHKYPYGHEAIKTIRLVTQDWNDGYKIGDAIMRLYKLYLAGLDKHPKYRDSLWLIIWSISYNISFPTDNSYYFYPMNMNISTTANFLLYKRSSKNLTCIKTLNGNIDIISDSTYICNHCDDKNATMTCEGCRAYHYCSMECCSKDKPLHHSSCNEVREIDRQLSMI